jgi:hypothetical protein
MEDRKIWEFVQKTGEELCKIPKENRMTAMQEAVFWLLLSSHCNDRMEKARLESYGKRKG